jgi:ribosomal protein S18 acetylase RimI-like enzyme
MNIQEISIEEFEKNIYSKYVTLFPEDEQRDWKNIKETYHNGIERFYKILLDEKNIIGFIMLEKIENMPFYIDYFAIYQEYQGKGYGTETLKILLQNIIKDTGLCIEIEKENQDDINTIRRSNFYKNLGFKKVNSEYELYNVKYTPYIYDILNRFSKEEVNKIMFNYYGKNCGKEAVAKHCKIIK